MIRSNAIRDSARAEPCTMCVPGVCNHDVATTVFAHLRHLGGGGTALKPCDIAGVYACSACHDWLDGRKFDARPYSQFQADRNFYAARALVRTVERLFEKGLIFVKGAA